MKSVLQGYNVKYLTFVYNCLHYNQIYYISFYIEINFIYITQDTIKAMMHIIMKKIMKSMNIR